MTPPIAWLLSAISWLAHHFPEIFAVLVLLFILSALIDLFTSEDNDREEPDETTDDTSSFFSNFRNKTNTPKNNEMRDDVIYGQSPNYADTSDMNQQT